MATASGSSASGSASSPDRPGARPSGLKMRFLSASEAASIDEQLFSPAGGFSIDQLMELAGLACAQVVHRCYPPAEFNTVLVAAGPGNQGGDGLVAARHLTHFGYDVRVWYPKEGKTELFSVSFGGGGGRGVVRSLQRAKPVN